MVGVVCDCSKLVVGMWFEMIEVVVDYIVWFLYQVGIGQCFGYGCV